MRCDRMLLNAALSSQAGRLYPHRMKRNRSTFPDWLAHKYLPALTRMSHRLLASVTERSRHIDYAIFCEMRAATLCLMEFPNDTFGEKEKASGTQRKQHPHWTPRGAPGEMAAKTATSLLASAESGGVRACRMGNLAEFGPRRFFSPATFSWLAIVTDSLVSRAKGTPTFFHRLKEVAKGVTAKPPDAPDSTTSHVQDATGAALLAAADRDAVAAVTGWQALSHSTCCKWNTAQGKALWLANIHGITTSRACKPQCVAQRGCRFFSHSERSQNCMLCSDCLLEKDSAYTSWRRLTATT